MKKFGIVSIFVVLSLFAPVSAHAEPWINPSDSIGPGAFYASVDEPSEWDSTSVLSGVRGMGGSQPPKGVFCSGFNSSKCNFDNPSLEFVDSTLIAPVCSSKKQINCLESVRIYKTGATPVEANFVREIAGPKVPADKSRNLTEGTTPSIFEASDTPNAAGATTYAVKLGIVISYDRARKKVFERGLNVSVLPFSELRGNFADKKLEKVELPNGLTYEGFSDIDTRCHFTENGLCAAKADFAPGTSVGVTFRAAKSIDGWFSGRISAPNIRVKSLSSSANLISVDALPVSVARFGALVKKGEETSQLAGWLKQNGESTKDLLKYGGGIATRADFSKAFSYLDAFKKQVKDTAAGTTNSWNFTNLTTGEYCASKTKGVVGFVSTNATVYQGSAPKFTSGFLDYKVSGLHYLPGGEQAFEGTYDLVMRSDYARCLYGFSKAPLSATVSVVNDKGTKATSTTVVSEEDGWLKLAAYGFTFSKKTIKVKITKKK